MVLGLGSDVIEIARIEASITRFGGRFLERVFTPAEIAYCQGKKQAAESFAARFAAKEATMKALGVGLGSFRFAEVEVIREESGAPRLRTSGRAEPLAKEMGVRAFHVSLTHTGDIACAVVIAE